MTGIGTDDDPVDVDAVVVDVRVEREVELATAADVELGPMGAIAPAECCPTNDPDVYAAGDCAEKRHELTGESID